MGNGIGEAFRRGAAAERFVAAVGTVPTTLGELTPNMLRTMAQYGIVPSYETPSGLFWRGRAGRLGYETWDSYWKKLPPFETLSEDHPIALSFGREGVTWEPSELGVIHSIY